MNVTELLKAVVEQTSVNSKDARDVIDATFNAIIEAAKRGEEVAVPGFGKFKVTARDERQGRNPATGETITIAASKKLGFSPSKPVKDALNAPPPKAAAKKKTAGQTARA